MNSKTIALWLLIFCFVASCRNQACEDIRSFSGVTERDANGNLIGPDNDDWTLRDHWSDGEISLFDTTYNTNCFPPSHFTIIAYPNPTTGQFQVTFNKTVATRVDLRLIDSECRAITSRDGIQTNSFAFQARTEKKVGMVRLYYKFIEDGCEYQGHGDIQINRSSDSQ